MSLKLARLVRQVPLANPGQEEPVSPGESGASIDELLDRAVRAINEGDRATATTLAGQVLSVDRGNPEAEDLLAAPARIR